MPGSFKLRLRNHVEVEFVAHPTEGFTSSIFSIHEDHEDNPLQI